MGAQVLPVGRPVLASAYMYPSQRAPCRELTRPRPSLPAGNVAPEEDGQPVLCQILGRILPDDSVFAAERAAIVTDERRQAAIVAFLLRFVEGLAGAARPALRREGYMAFFALKLLSMPCLASAVSQRATRPGGGLLRLLGGAVSRLLSASAGQAEPWQRGMQGEGLSGAVVAIDSLFKDGDQPQLMELLVLVLRPAAAAVMRLLELGSASRPYELGAGALWNFMSEIADRQPGADGSRRPRPQGVDAALAAHPLEVVRIVEALARLAAIHRVQLGAPPGSVVTMSAALLDNARLALAAMSGCLRAAPAACFTSSEGLVAVSGLVESIKKLAVQVGTGRAGAGLQVHSSAFYFQIALLFSFSRE